MAYIKWGLIGLVVVLLGAFFHYSLPQRDIVRITEIDVTRMDSETPDGQPTTRDVRFIFGKFADGAEMEYRNEDTGWGFPWYFKFDSANLANRAADFKSTAAEPKWVVIRHYGWRLTMFSMFPNALSVRTATGPDESLFPWFNLIFFAILIFLIMVIYRILTTLRENHVDPLVDALDQEFDETASWWSRQWRRLTGRR
ncbi:MAG: DUF1523 family protein [Pseudomonadota bacterium]